jgi:hypothetical protein
MLAAKKLVCETSSSNAELQSLSVSPGSLVVQPGTKEYTVVLPDSANSLTITAQTADLQAALRISGTDVSNSYK